MTSLFGRNCVSLQPFSLPYIHISHCVLGVPATSLIQNWCLEYFALMCCFSSVRDSQHLHSIAKSDTQASTTAPDLTSSHFGFHKADVDLLYSFTKKIVFKIEPLLFAQNILNRVLSFFSSLFLFHRWLCAKVKGLYPCVGRRYGRLRNVIGIALCTIE